MIAVAALVICGEKLGPPPRSPPYHKWLPNLRFSTTVIVPGTTDWATGALGQVSWLQSRLLSTNVGFVSIWRSPSASSSSHQQSASGHLFPPSHMHFQFRQVKVYCCLRAFTLSAFKWLCWLLQMATEQWFCAPQHQHREHTALRRGYLNIVKTLAKDRWLYEIRFPM